MKRVLALNQRAINVGVRGELGIYPVYTTVLQRGLKYAGKVLSSDVQDIEDIEFLAPWTYKIY